MVEETVAPEGARLFQSVSSREAWASNPASSLNPVNGGGGEGMSGNVSQQGEVEPLSSIRSNGESLRNFLVSCFVMESVTSVIPEGMGVGMFVNVNREYIDTLSGDRGVQVLLCAAQTLV